MFVYVLTCTGVYVRICPYVLVYMPVHVLMSRCICPVYPYVYWCICPYMSLYVLTCIGVHVRICPYVSVYMSLYVLTCTGVYGRGAKRRARAANEKEAQGHVRICPYVSVYMPRICAYEYQHYWQGCQKTRARRK